MIQVGRAGEVAVESKTTGDFFFYYPVNLPSNKLIVIDKLNALFFTSLSLDETVELQRIVLAGSTDLVDDNVIVSDLVALFSMIPEVADIFNVFATVVDQDIINGDDPLLAITGIRAPLQPIEALVLASFRVPLDLRDPAIETRLVGRDRQFPVDRRDILLICDHQTGEILSEVLALRFVSKGRSKFFQSFFDDCGKFYDSRHNRILHDFVMCLAIKIYRQIAHLESKFSTLQKLSYKNDNACDILVLVVCWLQ